MVMVNVEKTCSANAISVLVVGIVIIQCVEMVANAQVTVHAQKMDVNVTMDFSVVSVI